MDGLWNSSGGTEHTTQAELSRHRILRVNLGATALPGDASILAALAPQAITAPQGGPHFVLSGVTPDNSHTYGFEFCLSDRGINLGDAAAPPFTVTIWELIGTSQRVDQTFVVTPIWASLLPITGVGLEELWHTFDVNACAIRFQIQEEGGDDDGSILISLAEL